MDESVDRYAPRQITDRDEIRRLLVRDPIAAAYQLADLDSAYAGFCTWYGAGADELEAIVLFYTALSMPVAISYGSPEAVRTIFRRFHGDLPGRILVHMQPDHLDGIHEHYLCDRLRPVVRMGLHAADFEPGPERWPVDTLRNRDIGEIMDLYRFYPDHFFEPAQIQSGHYYGVRVDDRLAAVAGIHVFSPRARVACIGNIVTHPGYRGRGISTTATSHLVRRLIEEGAEIIALNVARHNVSAVRVYQKLGFSERATYLEGMLQHTLSS